MRERRKGTNRGRVWIPVQNRSDKGLGLQKEKDVVYHRTKNDGVSSR